MSKTYSISEFDSHINQSLMAVYIARYPQLGGELLAMGSADREDYFFHCFYHFMNKYRNVDTSDAAIYFGSTSKDKAGAFAASSGKDRGKYFKDKYHASTKDHLARIAYFERKYKCTITGEKDERRFLGHTHIWNKLATQRDRILAPYQSVIESACDNITMLPQNLNKSLVPLNIRNKVYQTWQTQRMATTTVMPSSSSQKEREEEDEEETTPVSTIAQTERMIKLRKMMEDEYEDW